MYMGNFRVALREIRLISLCMHQIVIRQAVETAFFAPLNFRERNILVATAQINGSARIQISAQKKIVLSNMSDFFGAATSVRTVNSRRQLKSLLFGGGTRASAVLLRAF